MKYDPAQEITKMTTPVLLLNGTKDLQVDVQEAQALKTALPKAQLQIIENMNHVLKTVTGNDLENSKTYNDTTIPLAEGLVPAITDFLKN